MRRSLLLAASALTTLVGWAPPPAACTLTVLLDDPTTDRRPFAINAMQAVLFGECRGVPATNECMTLVGMSVINRVRAHKPARYGTGIIGVVAKPYAYSCILQSDSNWRVIQAGLEGRLAPHSPDGIAWTLARGVALRLVNRYLDGQPLPDPSAGSVYYHTTSIRPAWVTDRGMRMTVRAGGHVFYAKDA